MKKFFLISVILISASAGFAQSFNTVGGLRIGTEFGITAKQRISNHTAIEGILQSGLIDDEVYLTALIEQHMPFISRRLNIYMGGGVHKGWITDERIDVGNPVGITLIAGIDFTVNRWNISYDFKPAVNISGGLKNISSQTALSLRYVFIPRDSKFKQFFQEKKWKFWKKKKDKSTKRRRTKTTIF